MAEAHMPAPAKTSTSPTKIAASSVDWSEDLVPGLEAVETLLAVRQKCDE